MEMLIRINSAFDLKTTAFMVDQEMLIGDLAQRAMRWFTPIPGDHPFITHKGVALDETQPVKSLLDRGVEDLELVLVGSNV